MPSQENTRGRRPDAECRPFACAGHPGKERGEWRISSYSGGGDGGGQCVEIRFGRNERVNVRDSIHPDLIVLTVPWEGWTHLLALLRIGE
ncbi:DUF397 domain-containing protein [Nocardiopsis endophytica]|uniref:DUF397 domain-containing protein n=1 Tax=Nocardiopsis endophytica TaxID=3018445 RepID=UPI0038CDB74F